MKRQHTQMMQSDGLAGVGAGINRCGLPSHNQPQQQQQQQQQQQSSISMSMGVDRELASMGYSVRSTDLAQVAHKLAELDMICSTQEDGVSHLASDTVHYNPSDLAGWIENMLAEINGPAGAVGLGAPETSCSLPESSTSSRTVVPNPYDCVGIGSSLGLYEAVAAASEFGLDGSDLLYPGGAGYMVPFDDFLAGTSDPTSCLIIDPTVIPSSSRPDDSSTFEDINQSLASAPAPGPCASDYSRDTPEQKPPKEEPPHPHPHPHPHSQQVAVKEEKRDSPPPPVMPKDEQKSSPAPAPAELPEDGHIRDRKRQRAAAVPSPAPARSSASASAPERPMVSGSDDPQESGVRLVHTLLACAEAVQQEKRALAGSMVKEIQVLASTQGGAMSKVARYFAEALARRIYGFLAQDTFQSSAYNDQLSDLLHFHFYETCPYLKFAHFTANQAILEAFAGHKRVHVIDFNLKQGMQWPVLLQALALRPGGPPVVRLTGIGPPPSAPAANGADSSASAAAADPLQEVGAKLTEFARTIHVELQFRSFPVSSLRELKPWLAQVAGRTGTGEAVAVNSILQLHRLLAEPPSAMEEVLAVVRAVQPKIVTVVEQEANHNKSLFMERFTEALHYYSTVFDSLEACGLPPMAEEQLMSELYLSREICNIVACEGAERVERHEPLAQWRKRMLNAGFRAVALGSNAFKQASMLLSLYPGGDGYRVEESHGCLTLGWHSRPLIAASAWHCSP